MQTQRKKQTSGWGKLRKEDFVSFTKCYQGDKTEEGEI